MITKSRHSDIVTIKVHSPLTGIVIGLQMHKQVNLAPLHIAVFTRFVSTENTNLVIIKLFGLCLGQFMGQGVMIDEIKSILIRPNFPPIPVVKSSYQSAEMTKRCWKSMNVGNQGQGLIEGTILDYVVPSLTEKNFVFKNST